MKKTLAFLLSLAMLFTALSVNVFAAETTTEPTIEIVKNSISNGKTTFAVKINGNPVKGVDITVNVEGVEGDDVAITGVSARNFDVTGALTDGEDYKIINNGKTLRAVGLQRDTATGEIISVTATATNGFTINVSCDIATSDKTKVPLDAGETVTADAPIEKTVEDDTVSQPEGEDYFIPYGSVFVKGTDGKYTYAEKGTNGIFSRTSGMTVKKFKIPTNGLGTFGISESMKETTNPSKQFGNYTNDYSNTYSYGTMIIVGDWTGFKDWYLAKKGYSDASLYEKVYNAFRTAMSEPQAAGKKYVQLSVPGDINIQVYDVPQTKVMWQEGKVLEYAVRVINDDAESLTYSAAAYCIKGDNNVLLSKDILTTVINGAAANN